MQDYVSDCVFWNPEDEQSTFNGSIEFINGKLHAKIYEMSQTTPIPQLNGVLKLGGKKFSLFNCFLQNSEEVENFTQGTRTIKSIYVSELIYIGSHLPINNEFKAFTVAYYNINDWIKGNPFVSYYNEESHQFSYSYDTNPNIDQWYQDQEVTITKCMTIGSNHSSTGINLAYEYFFKFQFINLITYEGFNTRYLKILSDFLTFVMNSKSSIKLLKGTTPTDEEVEINFLYEKNIQEPNIARFNLEYQNFIPDIFRLWVENHENLKEMFNLFFFIEYNRDIPINFKFLAYVQILEYYFRNHYQIEEQNFLEPNLYGRLIHDLLDHLPAATDLNIDAEIYGRFSESLRSRLRFLNELSLRNKIRAVIEEDEDLIQSFITDTNLFIMRVVDTRNYLTHLTDNNNPNNNIIRDPIEMHTLLVNNLSLIILIIISRNLDLELGIITRLVNVNNWI